MFQVPMFFHPFSTSTEVKETTKENKTNLRIKEIEKEISTLTVETNKLEDKLEKFDKEVSTTKELYAFYKTKNVNISYNETKLLIKNKKIEFQAAIIAKTNEIKKLEQEKQSLSIEYYFNEFLNKVNDENNKDEVEKVEEVEEVEKVEKVDEEKTNTFLDVFDKPLLETLKNEKTNSFLEIFDTPLIEDEVSSNEKPFLIPTNYSKIAEQLKISEEIRKEIETLYKVKTSPLQ